MKKFTFMLALLGSIFTSVQSAFATDEKWENKKIATVSAAVDGLDNLADGYYLLRNVGRKTFLRENDGKGLYLWNATDGSDDLTTVQAKFVNSNAYMSSVVYVTKNTDSDKYTMQFKSGQYLGTSLPHGSAASSNATAGEVEFADLGSSQLAFRPTGSEWANGNGNGGYSEGTFTGWETTKPGAGGNGAYQFFPVTLAEVTTVTCTWTVKAGENTLGTFTTEVENGTVISELPTMPEMSYFYTNPMLVTPENNVVSTDNCNFTINVEEANAPYTASTAANPTWYTIKLRNDDTHYICHVLPTDNGIGSHRSFTAEFCKNQGKLQTYEGFFWAFVKDGFGVKLLNKQTGKYVKASGQNAATLDANGTTFIVKTNSNNNSIGFSLQIPGSANIHIGDHVSGGILGGWNNPSSQNDNGSCFQITLASDATSLTIGKEVAIDTLSNFAVVEANKTMATARTQASVDAAKAAVEAATTFDGIFNACNMVYVPAFETGAYYRIQNINSITKKYLTSASIFVGKDGTLTTSYNASLSGDRVIRRVADDANFVSQLWQLVSNGDGTYKIKNANTGCRMSSNASPIDMPIDVNAGGNYTLKVVPTATFADNDGSTMLQMVVDNHIINAFSGDHADYIAAYDDANDKGGYWQFVKVTEVPVEISAANYATVGFPFAVKVPAESGIKAFYVSSIADGKMELTEFENGIIPANTGAILYRDGATTANLAITTTDATVDNNKLTATTAKRVGYDAESTYVLALNGEGNAAFLKSNLTSVPANKAYVSADQVTEGEGAAAVLNFVFGGTTTAINGVEANNGNNVEYYDLNGRRVLYPANGIFVTNAGKKVFIK
mgnify:CR=1 FL=1